MPRCPKIAPGAARYRAGRAFEWEVQSALESKGYYVIRAARSGGFADLVAVRMVAQGEVLFVQCKRDGRCPPGEWNALYEAATARGAFPIIAARGTAPVAIYYWRLSGEKKPNARRQPWDAFLP